MTLADLLMYRRARKGGAYYSDVAEAIEIPTLKVVRAERTFSAVDLTEEELGRYAEYLDIPVEELLTARSQTRSSLTNLLAHAQSRNEPVHLELLGGVQVAGPVLWRDRHAIGIGQDDGRIAVVYRSSIVTAN